MVNVEQITSRLSMMPDQALQQYAMMHKNDPYVLALAVSESNRRKQIRTAAVPPAQDMPKVADQAVAQMLPEQQGIGRLPAGDMNFADGGLVAFAHGGEIERYNGEFGSLTGGMLDNARARAQAAQQKLYTYGLRQRQQDPAGFQTAQQELAAAQAALQAAEQKYASEMSTSGVGRAAFGRPSAPLMPAPAAAPDATAKPGTTPQELAQFDAATNLYMADRTARQAQERGLGATPEAAATRSTAPAPSINPDMVSQAKTQAGQIYDDSGIAKLLKEKQELVDTRAAELRKGLKERPTEKAYLGLESSLKKEAEGEGAEKDKATGMAIFKAGLAMMSGASPHALQNIGKGAMVGAEEYGQAVKDFKKAAKDREKLMAEIEEKRRLQAMGDWEAAQAVDTKIADLQMGIKDKMIDATVKATGVKAELAGGLIAKELDYRRQVALKGMPSYSDTQEQNLLKQWLAKPENKGKTELDARLELGIGVGKGTASISDRIRGYQTILNDMTATDEEKANARAQLNALIAGAKQASTTPTAAPKIGEVVQGYRFKGGDPSNQANWEKVK